ncbi:hypothetical protein FIBSPDRAFT_895565 [Athelia psychrophila]|uniref:Uncharacterized protein n=1 Tax=Athelia psychrophila TaxID=1759441 RepID=A0A167T642_9AGAM|nr:hypothetical protein FIBSPDRAFT_1028141 [Fibularhizoctonia sp. CBS 109695]KZP15743.1 hypothetical protein FIBSPDRAFT_895565 [Fibularhizoctonia sp. CBS 109695]
MLLVQLQLQGQITADPAETAGRERKQGGGIQFIKAPSESTHAVFKAPRYVESISNPAISQVHVRNLSSVHPGGPRVDGANPIPKQKSIQKGWRGGSELEQKREEMHKNPSAYGPSRLRSEEDGAVRKGRERCVYLVTLADRRGDEVHEQYSVLSSARRTKADDWWKKEAATGTCTESLSLQRLIPA